jgi:murein DD-endopeptidase MepM/ murein hydrolase activator NlpD
MHPRYPAPSPFANSDAAFLIVTGRGGRQRVFHVGAATAGIGGALAALLLLWSAVVSFGFIFRDEIFSRLVSQQTEMQYAYEDRLAALRNQIDRLASRQLIDQDSIDGKLHDLLARQAVLETRHAVVAALAEPQKAAAPARPTAPAARADSLSTGSINSFAPAAPRPLPGGDAFELRGHPARASGPDRRLDQSHYIGAPPPVAIAAARDFAERVEKQQIAALEAIELGARTKAQRWSQIFGDTGLDPTRFAIAPVEKKGATGGPLVPIAAGAGLFERKLADLRFTLQQTDRMRRIVNSLPVHRPMSGEFDITSSFGPRSDPFTRSPAMHTGIDFRAPSGSPIRVTAAGRVVEADWVGGYGNMVEVDHGHGLTTRYAHMSSIAVEVGATINRGDIVGRVGSTGRSTGPHLHYETRLDGDPIDPMRFLRAAQKHGLN